MTAFDETRFLKQAADIAATQKLSEPLERLRYSDLNYTDRHKLLLEHTRDRGAPLSCNLFISFLTGMKSVSEVCVGIKQQSLAPA